MTQIAADQLRANLESCAANPAMEAENITLPSSMANKAARALIAVGAAGLALTVLGGFVVGAKHALASYMVGVMGVLALSLGALVFHMVFNLANSGWHVTIRRQMENIMTQIPLCIAMVAVFIVIELASGGVLLTWMTDEMRNSTLVVHKAPYLNTLFFVLRFFIYAFVWIFLTTRLRALSVEQDASGDPMLTRKARYMSGWGLLAFALTVSFATFDWMMSMDFRFFSTMWGVYYFAGAAASSMALLAIIFAVLRGLGRVTGAVTEEHFADIAKLMLGFTVFWAYVAYSQYFLIWYANIPEETFYLIRRQTDGWQWLGTLLIFGHFAAPFLVLLFRPVKRSTLGLALVGVWIIAMQFADMIWIMRPMVYAGVPAAEVPGAATWWVDAVAIIGVLGLYLGTLVRRIGAGPLVPLKDPRLHESLAHKNFVG